MDSLFDNCTPSVLVLNLAELDAAESVVEFGGDGAGLSVFRNDIFLACVEVMNLTDRLSDCGSAYGCGLVNLLKLIDSDVTALNLHTHILGKLHEAFVGYRGEDGA